MSNWQEMVAREVALQVGRNLARMREEARLSQEALGFRSSVHRTEISMLERGLRLARADTLLKVSGGLEATVQDLFLGLSWSPAAADPRRGALIQNPEDSGPGGGFRL